jgi:hypothetical protein
MGSKKSFHIGDILGVYTGIVMPPNGMDGVGNVMDHLAPGIGTIGIAVMQGPAAKELARQIPGLGGTQAPRSLDAHTLEEWVEAQARLHGMYLEIAGDCLTPDMGNWDSSGRS